MGSKKETLPDRLEKVTERQASASKTAPATIRQSTTSTRTTTSKYVREFESLFIPIQVEQLCVRAQNGQLRHCQFRSLCWRYFLRCLPEGFNDWLEHCKSIRMRYEVLRDRNLLSIKPNSVSRVSPTPETSATQAESNDCESNKPVDNPCKDDNRLGAQGDDKHCHRTPDECDYKSVFRTIERDVVRTFPDMEFFKQAEIQSILENVLFNFARENPQIAYKQGMHELLATLLYVAHTDSQNCYINYKGNLANETIATLLDLKYLEHDVFHLFSALMKSIETWYQNDEILAVPESPRSNRTRLSDDNGFINRSPSTKQQVNSVLGLKLKKISENIVRRYDRELFNHLEALQIAPQIYGIRWMRLLFGREFEFLDLLMIWDAIICDQIPMSLLDYVFASMLIMIREELVNGDYTDCLNNLMRHQFKDVSSVIKLALHLRDPITNARPKSHNAPSVGLTKYNFKNSPSNLKQQKNPLTSTTSLTSKLSQQYISHKQYLKQQISNTKPQQQQARQGHVVARNTNDLILSAESVVKEYEMREMQSTSSTSGLQTRSSNRFPMGKLTNRGGPSSSPNNVLNSSAESYDDLHSIVDYCWRLLSEQIDSLQRCLPKEKSLTSEDEIFVALAQLKKVRDVLKGSLRLEDELETTAVTSGSKY